MSDSQDQGQKLVALDKELFCRMFYNTFGGCIVKETTGGNVYDLVLCKFGTIPANELDEKEVEDFLKTTKDIPTDHLGSYFPYTIKELAKAICARFKSSPKIPVCSVIGCYENGITHQRFNGGNFNTKVALPSLEELTSLLRKNSQILSSFEEDARIIIAHLKKINGVE